MQMPDAATEARLTRKERQLLEILIRNAGAAVPKSFLLRSVWQYSEEAKTRTVDVHIQRLRRKLGPRHGAAIKTIVGSGYSWLPG
ncbi:MAG: helix-turn-helix domain-containing protein [Bryobacteraceae bacterium]